jgi:hypothetical protein
VSNEHHSPAPEQRPAPASPDTEQKGILTDVVVPAAQELKPIAEGVAGAWVYDKLTGGSQPPPADPPSDPPVGE